MSLSKAARAAAIMSSAAAAEQRSPDSAATSPGYQGSDGASSTQQTADRPASEKDGQATPASEPASVKEDAEPSAAAAGAAAVAEPASDPADGGAPKPSEEDATPGKEVGCCKIHSSHNFFLVRACSFQM